MSDLRGLVTAAGLSTRMGGFPKPLLHTDGGRFVEVILDGLAAAGVDESVVVLGHEHETVRARADLGDAEVVVNDAYEDGMLSSVQAGVRACEGADGLVLWPVDYPFASPAVVERLRPAFRAGDADVVQPTVDGESGHPALFGASTFDALLSAPEDEGARAVVYDDDTDVERVPVDDAGILADIDTPEEYWAAVKRHG
jgi:molybdenum cofactor cytidylyltransferase